MATAVDLGLLAQRADRAVRRIETQSYGKIRKYIIEAQKELEAKLKVLYQQALNDTTNKNIAFKQARAALLNRELVAINNTFAAKVKSSDQFITSGLKEASDAAVHHAVSVLDTFEPGLGQQLLNTGTGVNLEAVIKQAEDAHKRLYRYTDAFIEQAKGSVIQSMIQGESVPKATSRLRKLNGQLRYQAERIVRTETLSAHDSALRDSYKETGIEYVQRIATEDDRTCGWCAVRAGQVYPIDDAPAALHPNDRCYNVPWRQEWQDNGLIDETWMKNHAQEARAKAQAAGEKLQYGASPFEKMNKIAMPKAVWTPYKGYTVYGKKVLIPKDPSYAQAPKVEDIMPKLQGPKPPSLGDLLHKKLSGAKGSNAGGLYEDINGVKHYVKLYDNPKQAYVEKLANQIYNDLGLGAPKTKVVVGEIDGQKTTAVALEWIDNLKTVKELGLDGYTAGEAMKGFAADVLTANWDAFGTGLDNLAVDLTSKQVIRVDSGGTFLFRAQGALKPAAGLEQIGEWASLLNPKINAYYAQVAAKAGVTVAEDLGIDLVTQIGDIYKLRQGAGSWLSYIEKHIPQIDAETAKKLAAMLDARTKLLLGKQSEMAKMLLAKHSQEAAAKAASSRIKHMKVVIGASPTETVSAVSPSAGKALKAELKPLSKTAYLKKHRASWKDVFKQDPKTANWVQEFAPDPQELNSYLKQGTKPPGSFFAQDLALEHVTNSHTLGSPVRLYRAGQINADLVNVPKLMVGTIIEEPGYLTASLSSQVSRQGVADMLSNYAWKPGNRPVLYRIDATAATRGIYAGTVDEVPALNEMILAKGTKLQVKAAKYVTVKNAQGVPVKALQLDVKIIEQAGSQVELAGPPINPLIAEAKDSGIVTVNDIKLPYLQQELNMDVGSAADTWLEVDYAMAIKAYQRGEDLTKFFTLGGGKLNSTEIEQVKQAAQKLMEQAYDRLDEKFLYRGAVYESDDYIRSHFSEGMDVMFDTLTAATNDLDQAAVFADAEMVGEGSGVVFTIADDLGLYGARINVMEAALAPGSKYRVIQAEKSQLSGNWFITLKKPYQVTKYSSVYQEKAGYDHVLEQLAKIYRHEVVTTAEVAAAIEYDIPDHPFAPLSYGEARVQLPQMAEAQMSAIERAAKTVVREGKTAIRAYSGSSYRYFNRFSRGQSVKGSYRYTLEQLTDKVKKIDRVLEKAVLTKDVELYRGTSVLNSEVNWANPEKMVGTILNDTGFSSSSIDKETAWGFARKGSDFSKIHLIIEAKAGTKGGIYIKPWSDNSGENEFLWARHIRFRYKSVKVTTDRYGDRIIEAVVEPVWMSAESPESLLARASGTQ